MGDLGWMIVGLVGIAVPPLMDQRPAIWLHVPVFLVTE